MNGGEADTLPIPLTIEKRPGLLFKQLVIKRRVSRIVLNHKGE